MRALLLVLLMALSSQFVLGCTGIARSSAQGDLAAVQNYLSRGASPDEMDWKQRSAVELSIILDNRDILDTLIKAGADINRSGKASRTPMIWASMRFSTPDVIHKLADAGADLEKSDSAGQTPLLFSVLHGRPEQTQALIDRGADVDRVLQPKHGSPVLHIAIRHRRSEAVRILVAAGANLNALDSEGRTARELATRTRGMNYAIDRGLEKLDGVRAYAQAPLPQVSSRADRSQNRRKLRAEIPYQLVPTPPPAPSGKPVAPAPVAGTGDLRIGRYYALVIGNNNYQHLPVLRTAINDANALSSILRSHYDYEVTTLLDATRAEILRALIQYRRTLRSDDNLLIYYSGHGWLDEDADRGYWLPIDATQEDDIFWIANESVTSKTRAMRAKHVMVIADSCYSGKLVRGLHMNNQNSGYLRRLAERRARVVLTSGGIEPVSDSGGRDNHSVFAAAVLNALEENQGVLEGHALFSKVRRPVALNSDQIPEYSDIRKAGHDGGDFLFIRR